MSNQKSPWQHHITETHAGIRLDAFWSSVLEDQGISRAKIQKWIKQGHAHIDDVPCLKPKTKLETGQHVRLEAVHKDTHAAPHGGKLTIIYEDEDILVIDKPAGLTVHPAPSVHEPTLVNILVHHFPELGRMDPQRPGIVHRLDKDTTGLMIIARNETTRLALAGAFARREMHKEYLALVHGVPCPKEGDIDTPIGRHPTLKTRMAVVKKGGRPASSSYKLLWASPDKRCSLVRVRIHTGRTHQVRVHMTHMGHPLLGDAVYGKSRTANLAPALEQCASRQMLHAWRLGFDHPCTGKLMSFMCPPAKDMMQALELASHSPSHIALTGMSGSGKSTVLAVFEGRGIPTWSADACVARLYAAGGDGWEMLRGRFGSRFVPDTHQAVDKVKLFQAMQADVSLRREVEEMIHPMILWELEQFLEKHKQEGLTMSELPLLMEKGWHTQGMFQQIVGVFCPETLRHTLLKNRGWSRETIASVDSWQWSHKDKLAGCDLILPNDGDEATLVARTKQMANLLGTLQNKHKHKQWETLCRLVGYESTSSPFL